MENVHFYIFEFATFRAICGTVAEWLAPSCQKTVLRACPPADYLVESQIWAVVLHAPNLPRNGGVGRRWQEQC